MSLTTDFLRTLKSNYKEQEPKYIIGGKFETLGNPKSRNTYGSGGSVRELRLRFVSSCTNINENSRVCLKELTRLNKGLFSFFLL
jgi:hypothetical protein